MSDTRKTVVSLSGDARWKTHVSVGPHSFVSDAMEGAGGQDTGPSPEEFMLSAWGACTAMTLQMYAQRKGWPLEKVDVELIREERSAGKPEKLSRRIMMHGPLDSEQRERLASIAEKCPVHRTLTHNPTIETEIAEPIS